MTILASVGIALGPSRNRGQGQQGPLVGLGHSHSLGYGMSGHFNARNSVFELIGLLVADSSTALWPKDSLVQAFFWTLLKKLNHEKTQKIGSKKKTQPNFAPKLNLPQAFLYQKITKKLPL